MNSIELRIILNVTLDFFAAIRAGNRQKVEQLLLLDPSLVHARERGLTPVLVAAYHFHMDLANFLADKTVVLNIFEAAATGRITHLARILARTPDLVNTFSEDGLHPLALACFYGHVDAALYLIRAGASLNAPTNNAWQATALHLATMNRHAEIVRLLLEHGANPNVRQRGGLTPLHLAAANNDVQIIQMLILGGADLHIRSNDGKLPVTLARELGNEQAMDLLQREITKRLRIGTGK